MGSFYHRVSQLIHFRVLLEFCFHNCYRSFSTDLCALQTLCSNWETQVSWSTSLLSGFGWKLKGIESLPWTTSTLYDRSSSLYIFNTSWKPFFPPWFFTNQRTLFCCLVLVCFSLHLLSKNQIGEGELFTKPTGKKSFKKCISKWWRTQEKLSMKSKYAVNQI